MTDPVVLAAGDIAHCGATGDEATAELLAQLPDATIVTTGDNAYPSGTAENFASCYDPNWGQHKARTRPAPGNHDYRTAGAAAYFDYFGPAAGEPGKGYYSYDLGSWHLIALNSNCEHVGGCGAGSPQERWLRADLAAHPRDCTLAYWHEPRFSSSQHGNSTATDAFWKALYAARADVVLGGHDHVYERFVPQSPAGVADRMGVTEFVVGTGGARHYGFEAVQPNSVVREGDTFGVLKLQLHKSSYDWEFLPVAGDSFDDSGSAACVTG